MAGAPFVLLTFGEVLLTFTPTGAPPSSPLVASPTLQAVGGAELNTAVAFSLIHGGAAWASLLPRGPLGDTVVAAAEAAGVRVLGARIDGDVGTLHVISGRPHYQRLQSVFCRHADAAAFDWDALLGTLAPGGWLHITGITPLLGSGPRAAWAAAVSAACARGVHLSLDLNHRPALGALADLWEEAVRPHVRALALLVLSEDTLRALAEREGVWPPPPPAAQPLPPAAQSAAGEEVPDALHRQQLAALAALQERWGAERVGCCFKRPIAAAEGSDSEGGAGKDTLCGGAGVRRWSAVATRDDGSGTTATAHTTLFSTIHTPTLHWPVQALGGGDAWVAGFLSALIEAAGPSGSTDSGVLAAALRRGDLLAALQMATPGDLSSVTRAQLQRVEARWRDVPARLDARDCSADGSAISRSSSSTANSADSCEAASAARAASVWAALEETRFVAVVSLAAADTALPVARALAAGGVRALELVLRTPASEEALRRVCGDAQRPPGLLVGAGTVLSVAQAQRAVAAGADFLVAPGTNPEVVRWAQRAGVPVLPGVATATEVEAARALGLTRLKFFPAEALGGARTLAALSAPFPDVRWMPTGGVAPGNLASYAALRSVLAVGGSWLAPPEAVAAGDWDGITSRARAALATVAGAVARGGNA